MGKQPSREFKPRKSEGSYRGIRKLFRQSERNKPRLPAEPVVADPSMAFCVVCGCQEDRACEGGCCWVESDDGLDRCSNCEGKPARIDPATGKLLEVAKGARS